MAELQTNDQQKSLQEIAGNLSAQPGKYESSTKKMLKFFLANSLNAKENQAISANSTIIVTKTARIRNKAKQLLDSPLMQVTGDIHATLERMEQSKAAVAFHSQLKQESDQLKGQANQRQKEIEELVSSIDKFSQELHHKIAEIERLPKLERKEKLQALEQQLQAMELKAENLGGNVNALIENLHTVHRRAYSLLPTPETKGLTTPINVNVPKPE